MHPFVTVGVLGAARTSVHVSLFCVSATYVFFDIPAVAQSPPILLVSCAQCIMRAVRQVLEEAGSALMHASWQLPVVSSSLCPFLVATIYHQFTTIHNLHALNILILPPICTTLYKIED